MPSLLVAAAAPEHAVPAAFSTQSNQLRRSLMMPDRRVGGSRVGVVLAMVFAEVGLERRAAVAEQVVHGGQARRVIGSPLHQPALFREEPRRHEPAGRRAALLACPR